MVINTTQVGAWAEEVAWQHIQQQGWQLVERNFFVKAVNSTSSLAKARSLPLSK